MAVGDLSKTNTTPLPKDSVDEERWREETLDYVNRSLKAVCLLFLVANFSFTSTFFYLLSFKLYSWDGHYTFFILLASADTCVLLLRRFVWNYWNRQVMAESKKGMVSGDEQKKSVDRAVCSFFWLYVSCNLMIQCGVYYCQYSSEHLLSTGRIGNHNVEFFFIAQIVPLVSLVLADVWFLFVMLTLHRHRWDFCRSLDQIALILLWVTTANSTIGTRAAQMRFARYEVDKFSGKNDFGIWRIKMKALLTQQGLQDALLGEEKLSKTMAEKARVELVQKAYSMLILSLGDKVMGTITSLHVFSHVCTCDVDLEM